MVEHELEQEYFVTVDKKSASEFIAIEDSEEETYIAMMPADLRKAITLNPLVLSPETRRSNRDSLKNMNLMKKVEVPQFAKLQKDFDKIQKELNKSVDREREHAQRENDAKKREQESKKREQEAIQRQRESETREREAAEREGEAAKREREAVAREKRLHEFGTKVQQMWQEFTRAVQRERQDEEREIEGEESDENVEEEKDEEEEEDVGRSESQRPLITSPPSKRKK
eukprot:TRINITY_DN14240_c0_g1_i1.p1 TRINITY_DN14240_c0_g1~~TRINITY_DN14240_c0_g1_i1.p1  ORF type:complete len:228 (-),score=90.15 TRINITY_DN14240_c0_g1_i1:48-731(-)